MLDYYYPNKKKREIIEKNYLISFIKDAACYYKKHDYPYRYANNCLRSMSYFGNWLKEKNIPLSETTVKHAKDFAKQFIPPNLGISHTKHLNE